MLNFSLKQGQTVHRCKAIAEERKFKLKNQKGKEKNKKGERQKRKNGLKEIRSLKIINNVEVLE